ncbi:serine/threonine-protein kinase [Allocatelliglobosispora scoriae]|uniref:non-specific serine/threonine protein kinase n=1 Tax=Allocatelliglobosispora scoriae TaxID=643052 RepID=A0A841BL50_9ACTN|nr:serine/threonine-protein kinase [Allocatelliglobosispora scoriae]MBB5867591.1 serine/threonine-protein kinase [Allocatelliglobosispora scoriae]
MLDRGLTLGGRYTLVTLIARGGMGEVWLADDMVLDRRVAVKILLPNLATDPGFAARFRAEARAMAALSDPGIVEIYDYGQTDSLAYLVMQFVEGESLLSLVDRVGPLEPSRAMRILAQAADAIHVAHKQGIVHRDVKPANLLLRLDGRLALTDFGIARIIAADRLTAAGEFFGTASYLAPEQVTGAEIGPATDVYALGIVAYEMLAGRKPFAGDNPLEVALQHVNEAPPELPASIPGPVRAIVMRALAKDPAQRWPSAAALAHAAATARRELTATATLPRPVAAHAAAPRRRRWAVLAGAVAALVLVPVAIFVFADGGADDARPQGAAASPSASPAVAASGVPTPSVSPSVRVTPSRRAPSASAAPSGGGPSATASPTAEPSPLPAKRMVPGMYGWREVEVRAEMKRLELVARIEYRSTFDKCYVIDQSPPGGTVVPAGSTVDVVIATATGICIVV